MRMPRLGPAPPAFLPEWLPDETLFSLVSRYHRASGNASDRETSAQLFGTPRVVHHDFPAGLNELVRTTNGVLGGVREIAYRRTVLRYYLLFQPLERIRRAVTDVGDRSAPTLKYRLGLTASRFGARHPLKACPACMQDDRRRHGVAYWHLVHQYPGVVLCPHHGDMLHSHGRERSDYFNWCLPTENVFTIPVADTAKAKASEPARLLARMTLELMTLPDGFRFDVEQVCRVLRQGCIRRGFLRTGSQRLDWRSVGNRYLAHLAPLREFAGMNALPVTRAQAASQVRRVLSADRACPHPIRILLLVSMLFDSWQEFLRAYRAEIVSRVDRPERHAPPISLDFVMQRPTTDFEPSGGPGDSRGRFPKVPIRDGKAKPRT